MNYIFKNKKYIIIILSVIIGLIIIKYHIFYTNNYKNTLRLFKRNENIIKKYCLIYKVEPRIYIAIVYGELNNNFNEFDQFDNLRAEIGLDPSVGFAQMKVSTFSWIEKNIKDKLIKKSRNNKELLKKIKYDTTNIMYSILYIKNINELFLNKYGKNASVKSLGTYYSIGIDYGKDHVDSSNSNIVGETAEKFYYTNLLINEFPR